MENRMENKVTTPVVKGLVIVLILAVLDIVGGFTGIKWETWFSWISMGIFFVAIIWACISYANQMNNAVTFGNIFGHGFKTSAVVACLMIVYALISIYVIFPDTKEIAIEKARQQMEANPNVSEEMTEQALEITRKSFVLFAVLGSLLTYIIVGCIAAVLGAAFARKNPPTPFSNNP